MILITFSYPPPHRYKHTVTWEDGTIAYATHYEKLINTGYPYCGKMLARGSEFEELKTRAREIWTNLVRLSKCTDLRWPMFGTYLCEFDNPSTLTNRPVSKVQIADLKQPALPPGFVSCPSRHITHTYFACDMLSACWAGYDVAFGSSRKTWDIPSHDTCPISMTSLPPSYACARLEQRIPYTLVCDHRQDCTDNSDEDFCFHAKCLGHYKQCGNTKQVSL